MTERDGEIKGALAARQKYLGPSFSTHYANPLVVRRGKGTVLFDDRDQGFIDLVNNPASLGHCHPMPVRAAASQIAKLNTNTRYVYPELASYAQQLAATLPEGLHVCYFVNSGSEANDLALRMAEAYTKQKDVIVVDGAYHGVCVCVCVCVCVHTFTYKYVNICIYNTHIYICVRKYTYVCMCIYIYLYIHIYIHVYISIYIYIYIQVCVYIYIHILHIYIYPQIYISI